MTCKLKFLPKIFAVCKILSYVMHLNSDLHFFETYKYVDIFYKQKMTEIDKEIKYGFRLVW